MAVQSAARHSHYKNDRCLSYHEPLTLENIGAFPEIE